MFDTRRTSVPQMIYNPVPSKITRTKITSEKLYYTKDGKYDYDKMFPPSKCEVHPPPPKSKTKYYKRKKKKTKEKDLAEDFSTEDEPPADPPDEDPRAWLKRRIKKPMKTIPFDDWRTPEEMEQDYFSNPRNYHNYGL